MNTLDNQVVLLFYSTKLGTEVATISVGTRLVFAI